MSQRDFRMAVGHARPPSAWVMVTVASATLWITQQLEIWALTAQALALLYSLVWRNRAAAWQRSPWALNAGMIAIVTGTIVVALRGQPSTIALAHFAATTQGLQLLDARPRRTEFLLVALALFQVVLAANLTDSVFFTPLLVAFVFATVWTLLVHTLRSEAIEAQQTGELSRAFTPGLLRTTLFASALSVVLALVLFVSLPRLRSSVVRGSSLGAAISLSGFNDTVEFGELGRIRQDPRVVMRVETLSGKPPTAAQAYWRGLAFDTFDGTAWSITPMQRTPVAGSAEGGVSLGRGPERVDLVQRIVREPVEAGVLFRVGRPRGLQGTIRRLERDVSGGLYAVGQADERVRYEVRSERVRPGDSALDTDRALPPPRDGARYLVRPVASDEIAALARRLVGDTATDYARARAIEAYLLTQGLYSDVPPVPDAGGATAPIENFLLGGLAGHCEYFASGMVVLAREVGLPARLVNGFAGGRWNEIGDFVEVRHSDAHAWVEIHFERAGWVRFDPTPPDLRAQPELALSFGEQLVDLGSALELWWFQRVVGFDRSDQIGAARSAWLAWRERNRSDAPRPSVLASSRSAWRDALDRRELVLIATSLVGLALLGTWIARRRRSPARVEAHRLYARGLRLLARRSLFREPRATARNFALEAGSTLPAAAAQAFQRLTEAYLAERFGGHDADSEAALGELRRALRDAR